MNNHEKSKETVLAFIEEVFVQHNLSTLDKFMNDKYIQHTKGRKTRRALGCDGHRYPFQSARSKKVDRILDEFGKRSRVFS